MNNAEHQALIFRFLISSGSHTQAFFISVKYFHLLWRPHIETTATAFEKHFKYLLHFYHLFLFGHFAFPIFHSHFPFLAAEMFA